MAQAKRAVASILSRDGKSIRILPATIRRKIGVRRWFDNEKLVKTKRFIKETTEVIDTYRVRKIKREIRELEQGGENVTVYKVQLYAGFGGNNKEIVELVAKVIVIPLK